MRRLRTPVEVVTLTPTGFHKNRSPRRSIAPLCLAATLFAAPVSALAQARGLIFDYSQLVPGVWAAVLRQKGPFAITNSLIVVSDDGVLVVDTQQSTPAAQEIIAKIREITDRPVRWVLNTHEHLDHVGGNEAYRQAFGPQVAVLGHRTTRDGVDVATRASLANEIERRAEELRDRQGQFARLSDHPLITAEVKAQMAEELDDLQAYLEDLRRLRLRPPDDTFESLQVLRLGEREVHLIHPGPAHTQGDVAVWLPSDGILAAGDLLEDGLSILGETSTPTGWAAALERLSRLDVRVLLPGHGAVQDRRLLDRQANLFGSVVREAHSARREGLTLDQAWDRIVEAAEATIRLPDGGLPVPRAVFLNWVAVCIPRAWEEVAGVAPQATRS
jgi:glyoxylase-like metal-dependent hydrolase (beta-lactamase superfamily II)